MKMSSLHRFVLSSLLIISTQLSYADGPDTSEMQTDIKKIKAYFKNLGMYFGYDLQQYCASAGADGQCIASAEGSAPLTSSFTNQLTNATSVYTGEIDLVTTFLGALLPTSNSSPNPNAGNFQLVPSTNNSLSAYASLINTLGNQSFSAQPNGYTSQTPGTFSVSPLIDQAPYQNDPVNQALLNIISTPDVSFCINAEGGLASPCNTADNSGASQSSSLGGGPVLSQIQVMLNAIGPFASATTFPGTGFFALPQQNAAIVPQLNSDSLLGPLMFDNTKREGNNPQGSSQKLSADNQIQQATNYIRYASLAVTPVTLPNRAQYGNLFAKATNVIKSTPAEQLKAQSILASYLASLRVYAAQTSVGISNLYYILSRRMPQKSYAATNQKTSQALSEYIMATWRLQPPGDQSSNGNNQTWTTQINNASSATVEKEIAILLAEINYQLYLSRVQQERLLLTNSTLLLQSARSTQPNSDLRTAPVADYEAADN